MSAFNILLTTCECEICKKEVPFEVQFRYGKVWQLTYRISENLIWGGNSVGDPNAKEARIEGIGGPCPNCQTDNLEFEIHIQNNTINSCICLGTDGASRHEVEK